MNDDVTVRGTGNVPLHWLFSNKTIIFIRATDSALFNVFLTITHTPTKLKRLLTFDNFSVPFYGGPITVPVYVNDGVCIQQKTCLSWCFCPFVYLSLTVTDSWPGPLIKDAS